IINDGEKEMLKLWRIYIRNLKGIDFNLIHDKSSFDSIKWPCEPENTH
ncbi:tail fiber assembly protein, partial [Escherichia coli]|nr:tail fiber assembly protein [Escherichia coli]